MLSPAALAKGGNLRPAVEDPATDEEARGYDQPVEILTRVHLNPRLVCLLHPESGEAERYLRLRHALEKLRPRDRGIVVGVTSAQESEGKTLTAINLAGALAQDAGARVLLVDLDLRSSGNKVHDYLGLQKLVNGSAVDWIHDDKAESGIGSFIFTKYNLHLTLTLRNSRSTYELLKSPKLERFFERASQNYDFIVVDTPQILQYPDIGLIARVLDGFLVVVKADSTREDTLEEALNLMTQEQVLGLVFNGAAAPS
jgi:Mrp family chromosome partitioning ATPase